MAAAFVALTGAGLARDHIGFGGDPAASARASADAAPPLAPRQARGAPQLPDGVRVVPSDFVASEDVLGGTLPLPTGRLAVDDYFYGDPQVQVAVPAGRDPVRLTIARSRRYGGTGVALATLRTGAGTPVRWRRLGVMATDGGLGGFASAEAAERLADDGDGPLHERQLTVLEASRGDQVARLPVGRQLAVLCFGPGLGDGAYGVYAGVDAAGTVVRVVLDGGLLHLGWDAAGR